MVKVNTEMIEKLAEARVQELDRLATPGSSSWCSSAPNGWNSASGHQPRPG